MTADIFEAENAVVGSILIDSRCLGAVVPVLRPQFFGSAMARALYEAALRLDRQGKPIDPVVAAEEARRQGAEVPRDYLLQLMEATPTAANAREYAEIVRDSALRRGCMAVAEEIRTLAAEHTQPKEIMLKAAGRLDGLLQTGAPGALLTPDQAMLAFYRHRELLGKPGGGYVRTGYQDLDETLGGGLLAGGMYVLAARPGMGKTTFAINIADRVANEKKPVLFVSLEMTEAQLNAKRISREMGIPGPRLLMGALSEQEEQLVADAGDVIRALPVYINGEPSATVPDIEAMARSVKGLCLIVVDYIGKVSPGERGGAARYDYMAEISGALKTLASRLRVPVLALCQLNRAGADRRDKTPLLTDLRDSGSIEQDADGVIFLHREDYYETEYSSGGVNADLQVIAAKNRHGRVGKCRLAFDMAASKMTTSRAAAPYQKPKRQAPEPKQMQFEDLQEPDGDMPF